MNKAQGLINVGWFPEFEDGYPPLTMLVTTEVHDKYWTVTAHLVRIEKADGKPRNLTGHPANDLVLRAQASLDGIDPGSIFAYRMVREGFGILDIEDLQTSIKAIRTINRRVDRDLGGPAEDFKAYFAAVAKAIGADDIFFYRERRGWYPESTFDRLAVPEAIARIERNLREAL